MTICPDNRLERSLGAVRIRGSNRRIAQHRGLEVLSWAHGKSTVSTRPGAWQTTGGVRKFPPPDGGLGCNMPTCSRWGRRRGSGILPGGWQNLSLSETRAEPTMQNSFVPPIRKRPGMKQPSPIIFHNPQGITGPAWHSRDSCSYRVREHGTLRPGGCQVRISNFRRSRC
jgi:hypothetical protein